MEAQDLVDVLATRDAPCPICRYNLRGVARAVCPECGASLQLRVALRKDFPTAWLLAVIGAGIMASHLPDALLDLAQRYPSRLPWWWDRQLVLHYGSIGFTIALVALVLYRHRFVGLATWLQWSLAGMFLLLAMTYLTIRWQWIPWR